MLWSSRWPGFVQLPKRREARWLWRWHLAKIGWMECSGQRVKIHQDTKVAWSLGASQFGSSSLVTVPFSSILVPVPYQVFIECWSCWSFFEQGGCWMTSYVGMTAPWRPKTWVWFYLFGWVIPFVSTILWHFDIYIYDVQKLCFNLFFPRWVLYEFLILHCSFQWTSQHSVCRMYRPVVNF